MTRPFQRLSFVALVSLLGALGCKRPSEGSHGGVEGGPLPQTYAPPNGLVTAHYPPEFAARITGQNVVLVSRTVEGHDEFMMLVSVDKPVSDDVDEFARVLLLAEQKKEESNGAVVVESSHKKGTCFGVKGVEVDSTWTPSVSHTPYKRYSCTFVKDGHGFSFTYAVPQARAKEAEPLLRQMLLATTFGK